MFCNYVEQSVVTWVIRDKVACELIRIGVPDAKSPAAMALPHTDIGLRPYFSASNTVPHKQPKKSSGRYFNYFRSCYSFGRSTSSCLLASAWPVPGPAVGAIWAVSLEMEYLFLCV